MGVIVRKGAQAVEFLLAGGVPEGQFDVDVINEDIVDIVFEDGGLVYCRKVPGIGQGASDKVGWVRKGKTYPLVNTLSSEVLPQAPSPLLEIPVSQMAAMESGETVQENKLSMYRLASSAERHGG